MAKSRDTSDSKAEKTMITVFVQFFVTIKSCFKKSERIGVV